MIRYSIVGATANKVLEVGGRRVKQALITKIVFADMTESQASRLRNLGYSVEKVDKMAPSIIAPRPIRSNPTYSLEQLANLIGIDALRFVARPPVCGQGQTVAILDSGIRETHELVKGSVVYSKNFTEDSMKDGYDHGTGVASIVAEVAPLCGILDMKVLDNEGAGSAEDAVYAIEECIELKMTRPDIAPWVINLSIGSPDTGNMNDILRIACRAAFVNGILVVSAAGNSGPNPETIMSPACDEHVIAVGSARPDPFIISHFSSRGPTKEGLIKPDAVMFGEDIITASSREDDALNSNSGTSFAAPFMSGLCLLYYDSLSRFNKNGFHSIRELSSNGGNPEREFQDALEQHLEGSCVKPEGVTRGKDDNYGYGVPLGSVFAQSLTNGGRPPTVGLAINPSSMLAVGIIGMMMRAIKM